MADRDPDRYWARVRWWVTCAAAEGHKLQAASTGHPESGNMTAALQVLSALDLALSLSTGEPKAPGVKQRSAEALEKLATVARLYLRDLGEQPVARSRPEAASWLRWGLVEEYERWLAGEDYAEPEALRIEAARLVGWLLELLTDWRSITESIAVELPQDYGSEARREAAAKAIVGVLRNLRSEPLETSADKALRAALIALGYPTSLARTLFRQAK